MNTNPKDEVPIRFPKSGEKAYREAVETKPPENEEIIDGDEIESPAESQAAETHFPATQFFPTEEAKDFRHRWETIQVNFVDGPQRSVKEADKLISRAIQRLSQILNDERARLDGSFTSNDQVSTEEYRVVFQRYRSFFEHLFSV